MASTQDVLDHHLKSLGHGDLEGIPADCSWDALLMADRVVEGNQRDQGVFQAIVSEFSKPGTTFGLHQQYVEGDSAYIVWSAETADNFCEAATDTLVVRDGKIVAHFFAAKITPKR